MKKVDMEAKLESLVAEINKIKNSVISAGRDPWPEETAEIEELRSHIRNLEEIKRDLLKSEKDNR